MQQIVVGYLREDTIRKFSCIQAIHVAPGYLSAKVINLDAKCKCFGVYFLCLTIFYFGSANLFFESANQADGTSFFEINEAIHETIHEH